MHRAHYSKWNDELTKKIKMPTDTTDKYNAIHKTCRIAKSALVSRVHLQQKYSFAFLGTIAALALNVPVLAWADDVTFKSPIPVEKGVATGEHHAIFAAARKLDETTFAALLKKTPDINNYLVNEETLVSAILRPERPGQEFFRTKSEKDEKLAEEKRTQLAAQYRASLPIRIRMLDLALKYGAKPGEATRSQRFTGLYFAMGFGSPEMVRILLQAGADPNQVGGDHRVPLIEWTLNNADHVRSSGLPDIVSRQDRTTMLLALVEAGAKRPYLAPDGRPRPDDSELWKALVEVTEGAAILDTFLHMGSQPPTVDASQNLIARAAYAGNPAAVAWLQKQLPRYYERNYSKYDAPYRSTDLNVERRDAWSEAAELALASPIRAHRAEIFEMLVRTDADWSISAGDGGEMRHYLTGLDSRNRTRGSGQSLLSRTVASGDTAAIQLALSLGAVRSASQNIGAKKAAGEIHPQIGDPAGDALINALQLRRPDLLKELLAAGASPLAITSKRIAPLVFAVDPQLGDQYGNKQTTSTEDRQFLDQSFDVMLGALTPAQIRASDTLELTPLKDIVGIKSAANDPAKIAKLINAGFSLGNLQPDRFFEVLEHGDTKLALEMLNAGMGKNWSVKTPEEKGGDPREQLAASIGLAAYRGDLLILDRLLALRGPAPELSDVEHKVLAQLADVGNVEGLKLLQARGWKIDTSLNQPAIDSMQPAVIEFVLKATGTQIGGLCISTYPDSRKSRLVDAMTQMDDVQWRQLLALGIAPLPSCPRDKPDAENPSPLTAFATDLLSDPFVITGHRKTVLPERVRQLRAQGMESADFAEPNLRTAFNHSGREPALQDLLMALGASALKQSSSLAPADSARARPATPVGNYKMEGVREAAFNLRLKDNGRFNWAASYGAVDKYAEGNWHVSDDKVIFTSDVSAPFNWFKIKDKTQHPEGPDVGQPLTINVDVGKSRLLNNIQVGVQTGSSKLRFLSVDDSRGATVTLDSQPKLAALWFSQMETVLASEVALPNLPRLKSVTLALQVPRKGPTTPFNETMRFDSTGLYSENRIYRKQQ
jgi:hypothetical protein